MGNDVSTAADARLYSPEEREHQKRDLLGLLSLEQGASDYAEGEGKTRLSQTPRKNDLGNFGNNDEKRLLSGNEETEIKVNDCKSSLSDKDRHLQETDLHVVTEASCLAKLQDHPNFTESEKKGNIPASEKDSEGISSELDNTLSNTVDKSISNNSNKGISIL